MKFVNFSYSAYILMHLLNCKTIAIDYYIRKFRRLTATSNITHELIRLKILFPKGRFFSPPGVPSSKEFQFFHPQEFANLHSSS